MFGVLLESNRRPQRRRGVTAASVAVHAGLILIGVRATAESTAPIPPEPREVIVTDVFSPPPTAPPVTSSRAGSASRSETPVPVLGSPNVPAIPGFDVPDGLSSLEVALGDPLAHIDRQAREAVNGVPGRGSSLTGATVLDNRLADTPAIPSDGNAPPIYPDLLRSAAIEGIVEVEFIIDRNGGVRPGSIVALRSDHARFLDAVREALAGHRYLPAEVGGSPVAVRVRQRFAFILSR
jgi:protein TonB